MYGAKLKAIRQLRDYTQEYVARKAGIRQNAYCQIEKDEIAKVPEATLEKIAEVLAVSVADIKNPMPVVVSLASVQTPAPVSSNESFTGKVIEELTRQLRTKDDQINRLLQIIHSSPEIQPE